MQNFRIIAALHMIIYYCRGTINVYQYYRFGSAKTGYVPPRLVIYIMYVIYIYIYIRICDRFIIKVSSLQRRRRGGHIHPGTSSCRRRRRRRRGLLFFGAFGPPARATRCWRPLDHDCLRWKEIVISYSAVRTTVQQTTSREFSPISRNAFLWILFRDSSRLLHASSIYAVAEKADGARTNRLRRACRFVCVSNRSRVTVCFVVNWTRGVFSPLLINGADL